MGSELITVIVPVHNAENYLEECIESIIHQTYTNLEIILVDDASTDSSGSICDSYAKKDARVSVIHKEGEGEGGAKARNVGIDHSSGELFIFMDSDDYVEPDMLEGMYDKMVQDGSQGAVCSFHYVDKEKKELPWKTPMLSGIEAMPGKEAARFFLVSRDVEGFSWNKLFRREIIIGENIRFDDSMNSFVDMYGMFRALLACERVSFCEQKFYYYRQHEVSCVHTMSKRKLDNFRRVLGQIRETAVAYGLEEESRFFCNFRMTLQLFDILRDKKSYGQEVWKTIRQEYAWKQIYRKSIIQIACNIGKYLSYDKMKNMAKLFYVWINFS